MWLKSLSWKKSYRTALAIYEFPRLNKVLFFQMGSSIKHVRSDMTEKYILWITVNQKTTNVAK